MKFKVLVIAALLAACVQGMSCSKGNVKDKTVHDYDALAEQVDSYILSEDYAAAIPLLKRMHKLKPGELIPVEYLGKLYMNLPEERPALANALFWLTEAEKRGSSNDLVYYYLACFYSLKGDVEKAEAAMNKAFALGYSNFEWMSNDNDLVNFRAKSWWQDIAYNYTWILRVERQLDLFYEFASNEEEKSITDRITFYDSIVNKLKELAPNFPALQSQPLYYLASSYEDMGNYASAEQNYLEARAIKEKILGKEHPDYAATLFGMGNLYQRMGDYAKAESCYFEARAIKEKALGKEHPDYATTLVGLGALYHIMGDYAKAESCHLEARAIKEKTLGKEHPSYATTLNELGLLYHSMGDYAKTESCYLEARTIFEKAFGKEHPSYATTLDNMGLLYESMGDYEKAESCHLEARAIFEKVLGKEHPSYATTLSNMGTIYYRMGNYAKAESFFLEARAIREKTFGKEHSTYASSLNDMGMLYYRMGNYAKAENCYLEILAIDEKVFGKEHLYYAIILDNMGKLYHIMGDYAKAEKCHLEARAIKEKTLGKEHPYYATTLDNLYNLYLSKKEYARALAFKQEQIKINTDLVNKNFSFQTEQQRDAYWNVNSSYFESTYSLSFYHPIPASNILNYDNALFSKGLLLRTTNAVRDSIYASGNQALITKFEELGRKRQQISALRQSGGNEAYIKRLETDVESLDKYLTKSSKKFKEFQADLAINWQKIKNSLQPNEAAIEFVSFRIYNKEWTDTVQYAALVLKRNSKVPVWVLLCNESELQNILSKATGTSFDQTRIIYEIYGQGLYSLVWEPLEKELENIKTIYYSPSGLLHKITFGALPTGEDEDISFNFDNDSGDDSDEDYDFYDDMGNDEDIKRLADKYDLNLVSSTREVANFAKNLTESASVSTAVLYGGLDYNADEETMRTAARFYGKNDEVLIASAPPEGVTRGGAWNYLPATREEVRNIQNYLNRKQIPNTLYQDSYGNEESFKRLDGKKTGLIHLATHGFFLADVERKRDEREQQQQQRGGVLRAAENPLLRSGLLLAGGNHAWTNNPVEGVESGILTADKIAGMNLLGTKLVVMSACQTGLGDVNNGEGVFGLQRAFKLAGVETLIMSLWEVDDSATAKLMSVFYQEWLFSGRSKQEAFKEAQRQVRAEYPDPYYWAAFVMMD